MNKSLTKSLNASLSDRQVCGICLESVGSDSMHVLHKCKCSFCRDCVCTYFQFMIDNGHLRIYCPSFKCMLNSEIASEEILHLISEAHQDKYQMLFNNKVKNDFLEENKSKMQCPFCDHILDVTVQNSSLMSESATAVGVKCTKCLELFCATCQIKLISQDDNHRCNDLNESVMSQFDIKRCPNCTLFIQREGGCAQILCRNCSHVFCWHCLKSLENDFLLFHYDSGPCKNKLGHSRMSVFLNRLQTISICLGVSILMIIASPGLLILLPCFLSSKCRGCFRHPRQDYV